MLSSPLHRLFFLLVAVFSALGGAQGSESSNDKRPPLVMVAEITGVIGPATALYIRNAIDTAASRDAEALVLRLDTPGGLLTSTREIIEAILASPVPVVGYVAPSGAHAASAGTYILYAANLAAMAPGTNVGAATPVQIGGSPELPMPGGRQPHNNDEKADKRPPATTGPLEHKAINDAVALIRSLAELRGHNADWAEKAVREAATLHASQALEQNVIDVISPDLDGLLKAIGGRTVLAGKQQRTLSTAGAEIERIEPSFVIKALGVLANPNVALILMLIGTYGLFFELMSPGAIAPGVIGAISLVLGLYALSELPLDYAGLALLVLGIVFMITETFMPTFGILGIGGVAAFVIGAAMLVNTDIPAYRVSYGVIAVMAGLSAAFFIALMGYLWGTQTRTFISGADALTGGEAVVLSWHEGEGYVWAQGERWHARANANFQQGDKARILQREGLTLIVKPQAAAREQKS